MCGEEDEPSHHNLDQSTPNAFVNDIERERVWASVCFRSDEGEE